MNKCFKHLIASGIGMATFIGGMAQQTQASDALTSNQQADISEHSPFFTVGKKWVIINGFGSVGSDIAPFTTHQVITAEVEGEEEIDGVLCARLKITNVLPGLSHEAKENTDLVSICPSCILLPEGISYQYLYEEDGKIITYRNPGPYYEYVETGTDPLFEMYGPGNYRKEGDPYFEVYVDFNPQKDNANSERSAEWWIDGIGSPYIHNTLKQYYLTELMPFPTRTSSSYLVVCSQNNNTLYDRRNFLDELGIYYGEKEPASITILSEDSRKATEIYSLDGLKVTKPVKGNIYIINGKKIHY